MVSLSSGINLTSLPPLGVIIERAQALRSADLVLKVQLEPLNVGAVRHEIEEGRRVGAVHVPDDRVHVGGTVRDGDVLALEREHPVEEQQLPCWQCRAANGLGPKTVF